MYDDNVLFAALTSFPPINQSPFPDMGLWNHQAIWIHNGIAL